jgi:hypothetical protein
LELTILFSETNKIHKSLELVNYRLAFARLITIILPYNFVSPIILNTFASIAVALAKAVLDRRSFSEGDPHIHRMVDLIYSPSDLSVLSDMAL